AVLADDVLVEHGLDVRRLGDRRACRGRLVLLALLRDDVVAEPDALVADVDRRSCDELPHFLLRFPAERAAQVSVLLIIPPSIHRHSLCLSISWSDALLTELRSREAGRSSRPRALTTFEL